MWAQVINMILGIWLMAAPGVFGYAGRARVSDQIVGPIIATFGCIAIWEATRGCRWVNLPLGLWLIAAPWLLGFERDATINSLLVGVAVTALSLVRGKQTHRFGGGWKVLLGRRKPAPAGASSAG